MQPIALRDGNCKIRLKFASNEMAATKLKTSTPPTKPKINMEDFKELFAALFKIKDSALQARIMKAINNMPENCPSCSYNLLEKKNSSHKSTAPANSPNPLVKVNVGSLSTNKKPFKSTSCCSTQTMPLDFPGRTFDNENVANKRHPSLLTESNNSNKNTSGGIAKATRLRRTRMPHVIKNTQTSASVPIKTESDELKSFQFVSSNNAESYCVKLPASTYLQNDVSCTHLILL